MDLKKEIKLIASEYDLEEQSELLQCPKCKGGFSKEHSFSIKRLPEGVLYNCFRASCGINGFIPSNRVEPVVHKHKEKKNNPFKYDVSDPEWLPDFLAGKFPDLSRDTVITEGIRYSEQTQSVLYPCYNYKGFRYAWNARAYPELKPEFNRKSIMYFDSKEEELLHFPAYINRDLTHLTVVEDIPSALVLDQYTPCISLLGTNLSENEVRLLTKLGVKNLTIALDPDAMKKAVQLRDKYRLDFYEINILYTPKDIKDLTHQEIQKIL